MSDAALSALADAPCGAALSSLSLSGCKRVTDAGLAAVARCAPQAGLTQTRCHVTHPSRSRPRRLPRLRRLDLTRCPGCGDAALLSLASRAGCPLEELVLYADAQFGPAALAALLTSSAPALRRLDLCGAAQLTDASLLALLGPLHSGPNSGPDSGLQLETLNLTWCVQLTDASLAPLLAACPRLAWLSLHGVERVGPAALDALAASPCAARTLRSLDVRGCAGLPAQLRTPEALRRRFPALRHFVLHS